MDKVYDHKKVEEKIYKTWEENGYFKPEIHPDGKPYTIILPPPNANAPLHFGHAMMVLEDILIRYHRMKGYAALWVPGADHAGFETQFVFEKKLALEGKSRFDYDRETLYQMVWDHVQHNKSGMENQLRKLGFSLDWSREKFTLDPDVVKLIYKTFKKMYDEGLVYRDFRLVNYCTYDGTSFSDLEVVSQERDGELYYITYPLKNKPENITIATTRPETLFGDLAVMVHPDDPRYKDLIGGVIALPLTDREIPIITYDRIDQEFGTGAVKVTPAHDFNDFEVGKLHNLPLVQVIGFDGKMQNTGVVDGLFVKQARVKTLELLKEKKLLEKTESHHMVIKTCYKCKNVLEPLPLEQWFIKVESLVRNAIQAVEDKKISIYPNNFESTYFQWLENLRDWNISRQVVWGMRIPAWKNTKTGEWFVSDGEAPEGNEWEQDSDTFDTWFSSSQWPFVTLKTTQPGDFEKFYPTSVMETGYDILKAWVSRMVMMGIYATDNIPFRDIVLHGLVNDPYGKKMSKSKGNVVNPMELVEQYGADSVRFALVYGTALGNDQALSYPKLEAMRRFSNKLWNMGRFIEFKKTQDETLKGKVQELPSFNQKELHENDKKMIQNIDELSKKISEYLDNYQFNLAAERLYDFTWHEFADNYIEDVKNRTDELSYSILISSFTEILKLLHPFMPFITEEIYQTLPSHSKSIMIENWPQK